MPTRRSRRILAGLAFALVAATAGVLVLSRLHGARGTETEAPRSAQSAPTPAHASELERPALGSASAQESPPPRVAAERNALILHVVDPAGVAVAGAVLALFRESGLLHITTTDAQGTVRFDAAAGSAEYALVAAGWASMRGEVELAAGERTLSFAEGESVAGTVLIDERVPEPPLELEFRFTDRDTGTAALPKAVQEALRTARGGSWGSTARTKADGTFEFRGLSAQCAGALQWSGPYFLDERYGGNRGNRFPVAGPRRDLVLHLSSGFELRLRVVDSLGVPLPGAPVTLNQGKRTETARPSKMSSTADSEGRFVRDFLLQPDAAMEVVVALVGGGAAKEYVVHLPVDGRGILDLGDLATEATREISVLVLDDAEAPLIGATVAPLPWGNFQPKTITDATGRIQLQLGHQDHRLGVTALGYLGNTVDAPPGATEIVARMTRATMLECFVAGAGDAKHGLRLELSGPNPLFVGQDGEGPDTPQFSESSSMTVDRESTTYEPRAGKDGRWKIAGLTPGQTLHVVLSGSDGQSMCAMDVAPLSAGEQRTVELRPTTRSRSLRVRVVGPDRAVLPKASVRIATTRSIGEALSYAVDARGEVELPAVFGDPCGIEARAPGFPPRIVVVHGTPAEIVEIVLEAPRSIEVELVAQDGKPVEEPISVHASSCASSERGTPLGAGRYRIDNLPAAVVLVVVFGRDGMTTRLHDTREPFVKIALGGLASVRAQFARPADRADSTFAFALAVNGSAADTTRSEFSFDTSDKADSTLRSLPFGAYDAWLEQRSEDDWNVWSRVGSAQGVVLDAEHPSALVELHP